MPREAFNTNEEFTIQGKWWRPGGQHTVFGDLHYRDRNLTLKLMGAFDDARGSHPWEDSRLTDRFDVLYGQTANGTLVTVCDSFYSSLNSNVFSPRGSPTYRTSTVRSHGLILGIGLDSSDEECFKSAELEIPYLARWLNDCPFSNNFTGTKKTFSITYTCVDDKVFEISDDIGRMEFIHRVCPNGVWEDGTITHTLRLRIIPPKSQNYRWYLDVIHQLERLLRLISGMPLKPVRVTLFSTEGAPHEGCDLFVPCSHQEVDELGPHDFLIQFPEIENRFGEVLTNWFSSSEKIRHALDLFFSTVDEKESFLETRFLPLVQAAEVYARALNHGTIVSKAEYKTLKKTIELAIPEDTNEELRQSIKSSIAYANERNLRLRLIQVLDELEPETRQLFCVDHKTFVKGIVDTRNFYTHYSNMKKTILRKSEMVWAIEKIKQMMTVLLLKYFGLPEREIQSLVAKDYHWNQKSKHWKNVSEVGGNCKE